MKKLYYANGEEINVGDYVSSFNGKKGVVIAIFDQKSASWLHLKEDEYIINVQYGGTGSSLEPYDSLELEKITHDEYLHRTYGEYLEKKMNGKEKDQEIGE